MRPRSSRATGLVQDLEPRECDVVLTQDHEYYVWKGTCIAVRERASGRFIRQASAMGVASVHRGRVPRSSAFHHDVSMLDLPRSGEWLCLERNGVLHYVGPVLGCERRRVPQRRIVASTLRRPLSD